MTDDGKRAVLQHVGWVDGHADVGAVLADPRALAGVVGPAPVVDELPDDGRARLGRVTSLVTSAELGDPDGRRTPWLSGGCAGWPGARRP